MLPSPSLLDPGAAGLPVQVPPPPYFTPLSGSPRDVKQLHENIFPLRPAEDLTSAAQYAGIRYESKAQRHLIETIGPFYQPSPAFSFLDGDWRRVCAPDGLLESDGYTTLFEIKHQHSPEAWWQLRKLYQPVLQSYRPKNRIYVVEVCKLYDPATPFPEKVQLITDLKDFCKKPINSFAVYVWRP